jgi:hypothetical protein
MMNEQTRLDCIAMKREAQEKIYEEVEGMTPEEEIAYFRRAVASSRFKEWWEKIGAPAEKD